MKIPVRAMLSRAQRSTTAPTLPGDASSVPARPLAHLWLGSWRALDTIQGGLINAPGVGWIDDFPRVGRKNCVTFSAEKVLVGVLPTSIGGVFGAQFASGLRLPLPRHPLGLRRFQRIDQKSGSRARRRRILAGDSDQDDASPHDHASRRNTDLGGGRPTGGPPTLTARRPSSRSHPKP